MDRNDDDARTRAAEIAEEIERLASQAAPLTEQERIRLLCYIETADHLAEIDEAEDALRRRIEPNGQQDPTVRY